MALRAVIDHPKFADLKMRLGLSRFETLGLLESIWHFAGRFTPQGNIGKYSDDQIEAWIEWKGAPGAAIEALQSSRWIDPCSLNRLVIHDWHEHADKTIKQFLVRNKLAFVTAIHPSIVLHEDQSRLHEELTVPSSVFMSSEIGKVCVPPEPEPEPDPVPAPAPVFARAASNQPETQKPAKSHQPCGANSPNLASIGGATQFPAPPRQSDTPEIAVARSSAENSVSGNSPHRLSQAPPADREERDRIVEEGWSYLAERYPNQSRVDSANRFWISECALQPDIPALRAYVKLVRDGLDHHLGPPLVAKWANDHGELQARFVPALDAFLGAPSLNGRSMPSKLYLDRPPKWQARDAPVAKGEAMWAEVEKILQADAAKREGWKKKREIA